ncbi:HET-domain-containing protein [Pseudovirgaria hyperparasitica]|uniref:HET-domain-containing protein n=1 Tax=Pseudovirgaria hyperparasitica TaxID=470096 RepID=A0A6A6WGV2_9PEZI|nr:HET-domain-containing protein [Pseudovirgaria hyperparasitica]KAF2761280.1 HET-domain-containing protein [Pseudovirgaria hyperparasitica]
MRLLSVAPDGGLQLKTYSEDQVPPYAILSHTWGRLEDYEVTYRDVLDGTGLNKPGYEKLLFCHNQAMRHDLTYFWVDACCIDKSNSTELQEAINSMFRWYQRAERCYVYLTDVSIRAGERQLSREEWLPSFESSRWHTRAWTLQELIAPRSVEFYSREHVYLGDKVFLAENLRRITSIDNAVLSNGNFLQYSIDDRIRWCETRQATKSEDKVYSLLGLCNIYLPLIYGEGEEHAMRRLRKEISEADHLITAPARRRPFMVPFERNSRFTGREHDLSQVSGMLFRGTETSRAAIVGLGGIGKTQVAIELAYRAAELYPDCAIFWIPMTNTESLDRAYSSLADELDVPGRRNSSTDLKLLVQMHMSRVETGRWLMIFDNADSMETWTDKQSDRHAGKRLIHCLPKSALGSILFTSRDKKVAVKLAESEVIVLKGLEPSFSVELLRKSLIHTEDVDRPCESELEALGELLTHLPLALSQAAAYLNSNDVSIATYLTLFQEQDDTAIELLSEEFEDQGRYETARNPIAATWLISFERIRATDNLAAEYLSLMACLEHKDIPHSFLPAGPSKKKQLDAIGTLTAYSFLMKTTSNTYNLHRLVHHATWKWLKDRDLSRGFTRKALERLDEVVPMGYENRHVWRQFLGHMGHVLDLDKISVSDELHLNLTWRLGHYLKSDGRYREAELRSLKAWRALELEPDSVAYRTFLTHQLNLGLLQKTLGEFETASQIFEGVTPFLQSELGAEHPSCLQILSALAHCYLIMGRLVESGQILTRVLESQRRILGDDHPDTLDTLKVCMEHSVLRGDLVQAERLGIAVIEGYRHSKREQQRACKE